MTMPAVRPDLSRAADIAAAFRAEVDDGRHLDLLDVDPSTILHQRSRFGVHTLCMPNSSLTAEQSAALVRFRIGNYVRVGFVDVDRLAPMLEGGSPLGVSAPDDIHIVSMSAQGQILCTAILRTIACSDDTVRLRDLNRPLFPVELVHGHNVFNGLRVLSDLPVVRIRELGGFVKTKLVDAPQLTIRATIEVGIGLMRVLAAVPMTLQVDALVGDLDPAVAKANLEYFGIRIVVLSSNSHQAPSGSFLGPRYADHDVHPFAMLTRDSMLSLARLEEIDRGLDLPDAEALMELLRLRETLDLSDWSTLTPEGRAGLLRAPQDGDASDDIAEAARQLRDHIPLLQLLTDEQITTLALSVEEVVFGPDEKVIRQGEVDDSMFMVKSGEAVVLVDDGATGARMVGEFGPGDCFGELAVLLGEPRTATVLARTELTLWRLSGHNFRTYREQAPAVDRQFSRTAIRRVFGRLEGAEGRTPGPTGATGPTTTTGPA
jgi:hypothetical protein